MSLAPDETRTLAALLDRIVPPSRDGRLPGAGELGLAPLLEERLDGQPALRAGVATGLSRLEEEAVARGARGFAELAPAPGRAVLDAVAAEVPAFLGPLVFMTYLAYYSHPRILEALGLSPRPPFPEGYTVPPTDLSLLEPVRGKRPFYRTP